CGPMADPSTVPQMPQRLSPTSESPLRTGRQSSLWRLLAPWGRPTAPVETPAGIEASLTRDRSTSYNTLNLPPPQALRSSASSMRASVDVAGGGTSLPHPRNPALHSTDGQPFIILDKRDHHLALSRYHQVLRSAEAYRWQWANLGQAAYEFGHALENLARSPGAGDDAAPGLLSASGLHYVLANQYALQSHTIHSQFEEPFRERMEQFATAAQQNEHQHDQKVTNLCETIRRTEDEYVLKAHQGARRLGQFRQGLQKLSAQLDQLDQLKQDYATQTQQAENDMAVVLLNQTSTVIRALVDICDRVSEKAVSDPQLEAMLSRCPDPFNVYATHDTSQELFSVLKPLAMDALVGSVRSSYLANHDTGAANLGTTAGPRNIRTAKQATASHSSSNVPLSNPSQADLSSDQAETSQFNAAQPATEPNTPSVHTGLDTSFPAARLQDLKVAMTFESGEDPHPGEPTDGINDHASTGHNNSTSHDPSSAVNDSFLGTTPYADSATHSPPLAAAGYNSRGPPLSSNRASSPETSPQPTKSEATSAMFAPPMTTEFHFGTDWADHPPVSHPSSSSFTEVYFSNTVPTDLLAAQNSTFPTQGFITHRPILQACDHASDAGSPVPTAASPTDANTSTKSPTQWFGIPPTK
ncbi:hypothetical protein H4R34_002019, partial [Dimargaris verticillata]